MAFNNMFCRLMSKKLANLNHFFKLLQKYNTVKFDTFIDFFEEIYL